MSAGFAETGLTGARRYARLVPFEELPGAVEMLGIASDPALAADLAGLDFATLDNEDRQLLARAHRQAIGEGLKLIEAAAREGGQRAREWLSRRGLTPNGNG